MRILNPKKSSGSSGVTVNESGDLSFDKVQNSRADKFATLKASLAEVTEIGDSVQYRKKSNKKVGNNYKSNKTHKAKKPGRRAVDANETPEQARKKEYSYLYQKGIHLLSMREHSVKEVSTKLSAKSDRLDLVSAVVDELIDKDYLSNSRFTESYVRAKQLRGFGPTKIRSELSNKDIKNNMIEIYLDASSAVWYDSAQNQYTKKYGDEPISDYNTWTKRARFMQSRGFTMEHIHSTVPQVESN